MFSAADLKKLVFLTLFLGLFPWNQQVFALQITWFGHSAFLIQGKDGTTLLIDPWISNPLNNDSAKVLESLPPVDFILLTHGHGDHLGDTLNIIQKNRAKIVTSYSLANHLTRVLAYPADRLPSELTADIGGTIRLNSEVSVTLTQAVHSSEIMDKTGALHNTGTSVGFILEFLEGKTIYFTGDTDLFLDMKLIPVLHKVDIMIACIGGHFTMGPKRAALATAMVKPRMVIPMHFQTYPLLKGSFNEFRDELQETAFQGQLQRLEINEKFGFE